MLDHLHHHLREAHVLSVCARRPFVAYLIEMALLEVETELRGASATEAVAEARRRVAG